MDSGRAGMRPTLVDLFCGIGVGSLGFANAGFQIVAAVDIDSRACGIYENNLSVKPIPEDLRKISGQEILNRAGLKRGEVTVCVGCPPCQGFSSLRRTRLRKGQRDGRKSLLRVFADRIEEIYPKIVVLENVRGLTFNSNRRFFNDFLARMRRLKYNFDYGVLDAADYGTPQHRWRVIFIGTQDTKPVLPEATNSSPDIKDGKAPWKVVREAIGDLPPLEAGQKDADDPLHCAMAHSESVLDIIRNIPHDGGGRKSLPRRLWLPCHKRLPKEGGAESIYGRMRWDSPSPTITTRCYIASCGRFVHPVQDRAVTLREAARLQSIPNDFELSGYKEDLGRWIGNAMPLNLAEAIGRQAMKYC